MHINFFLIPYVILLGILLSFYDNKHNRGLYIILCSMVLLFVAVLRSPEWLAVRYRIDTLSYKELFEDSYNMGWKGFWNLVQQNRSGDELSVDIGFFGLMMFIGQITHSFYFFSFLADLIFFVPFCIIIYRYCTSMRQIIFVFVFYISMMQVGFLGGGRQNFAIGFDLFALLAVVDRKKWQAIVLFLIGVTVHLSSLLFLIPLLMIWFNIKPNIVKALHIICFVMFPIVVLFPTQIIVFLGSMVGSERYANYGMEMQGGAITFIVLIELLSLFCLVAIKRKDIQSNSSIRLFYVMAPLFTVFAPLIYANGAMIRLSAYFHNFLVLLVPMAIDCMFKQKNNNTLVYVIVISVLCFLTLKDGGVEYYFFWQNPSLISY